jgi:hypothetical protein
MEYTKLDHTLRSLELRVARIEALAVFLTAHPRIGARCTLRQMGENVALSFEGRAYIRPMGNQQVTLRLEKQTDPWDSIAYEQGWSICDDVSKLSTRELANELLKVGLELGEPEVGEDAAPPKKLLRRPYGPGLYRVA